MEVEQITSLVFGFTFGQPWAVGTSGEPQPTKPPQQSKKPKKEPKEQQEDDSDSDSDTSSDSGHSSDDPDEKKAEEEEVIHSPLPKEGVELEAASGQPVAAAV
jgi:hypothetical protein